MEGGKVLDQLTVGMCNTKKAAHKWLKAFRAGVIARGDKVIDIGNVADAKKHLPSCDVTFQICESCHPKYGHMSENKLRIHVRNYSKEHNKRRIILDVGLMGKYDDKAPLYSSIGFDGVKGSAQFYCIGAPDDRRIARNIPISGWKSDDKGEILIIGQTFNGFGLEHLGPEKAKDYFINLPRRIREYTDRKIIYRMHPNQTKETSGWSDKIKKQVVKGVKNIHINSAVKAYTKAGKVGSKEVISHSYKSAYCAITRTSAGIVEGLCAGVPSISEDPYNIANMVSEGDLANIENSFKPDRIPWLNALAYAEWTGAECKEGLPWRHLRPYVNKNRHESTQTGQDLGLYTASL